MDLELSNLKNLVSECDNLVDKLLSEFNWTKEEILKEERTVICPFDNGHRMNKTALEKHVKTCELKQKGYNNNEIREILDSSEPATNVNISENKRIVIDAALQQNIIGSHIDVPLTPDRIAVDLNREQRLSIYNYTISAMNDTSVATTSKSSSMTAPTEDAFLKQNLFDVFNAKLDTKTEPSNKWEVLVTQRDMKRRKQSYRKNVHTSRKSYNEILAQVIENHCSYLRSLFDERQRNENEMNAKSFMKEMASDFKSSLQDTSKSVESIRESTANERSKREDKHKSKHSSHKHKHKHHKHKRTHEFNESELKEKHSMRK